MDDYLSNIPGIWSGTKALNAFIFWRSLAIPFGDIISLPVAEHFFRKLEGNFWQII